MIWKFFLVVILSVGTLAESPIKALCRFNGVEDKAEEVQEKLNEGIRCFNNLFDLDDLKKEAQEALPNGTVKEVIKKYCLKSPQLKTCLREYFTAAAPCQLSFIRDNSSAVFNATDEIIDFICFNDGANFDSFFSDGGVQCFKDKNDEIQACADNLKSGVLSDLSSWNHEKHCAVFNGIRGCVITPLDGCPTRAAVNLAQQFFTIASKAHMCTK